MRAFHGGLSMTQKIVLAMLLMVSLAAAAYGAPDGSAEQEIRKLDEQRLAAILKEDIPMLDKLMTDDFVYTHSSGNVQTKAQFLGDMKAGTWAYKSLKLRNVKLRIFGDTAILNGGCNMTGVMRGKDIRLAMYFTEVYVRTRGQWHWLLWQSTRLPPEDPAWQQVATQHP
jgi:ketosteroid isomerase-like protein